MIGKHRSTRLGMLTAGFAALVIATPLAASQRSPVDKEAEARIGRCISSSSTGRGWLEKTLWGLRDQEGGWIGAEVANADGSHDLGPLQVNSWWVARVAIVVGRRPDQVRWWLVHDACFNVDVARWIFLSALSSTGDYWKAVGVYHSPTAWRARRYATSVASHLRRRFGPDTFVRPAPLRTAGARAIPASAQGELQ